MSEAEEERIFFTEQKMQGWRIYFHASPIDLYALSLLDWAGSHRFAREHRLKFESFWFGIDSLRIQWGDKDPAFLVLGYCEQTSLVPSFISSVVDTLPGVQERYIQEMRHRGRELRRCIQFDEKLSSLLEDFDRGR